MSPHTPSFHGYCVLSINDLEYGSGKCCDIAHTSYTSEIDHEILGLYCAKPIKVYS
jgi:hypothetical protein